MKNKTLQEQVIALFEKYKREDNSDSHLDIQIKDKKENIIGCLTPCQAKEVMDTTNLIPLLAKWRAENNFAFSNQPKVTNEGTSFWYDKFLIDIKDRILFIIKSSDGKPVGHLGLWTFDYENKNCELDNLIGGEKISPGLMVFASQELIKWTYKNLDISRLFGRILKENTTAIKFWELMGFNVVREIPMAKMERNDMLGCWEEIKPGDNRRADKYEVVISDKSA